jgi:hypothetical protein
MFGWYSTPKRRYSRVLLEPCCAAFDHGVPGSIPGQGERHMGQALSSVSLSRPKPRSADCYILIAIITSAVAAEGHTVTDSISSQQFTEPEGSFTCS